MPELQQYCSLQTKAKVSNSSGLFNKILLRFATVCKVGLDTALRTWYPWNGRRSGDLGRGKSGFLMGFRTPLESKSKDEADETTTRFCEVEQQK